MNVITIIIIIINYKLYIPSDWPLKMIVYPQMLSVHTHIDYSEIEREL